MRHFALAVVVAVLGASQASTAEPASFSPAVLVQRPTGEHMEQVISVFPLGRKEFDIPLPLITRWFAYGQSGQSVYGKLQLRYEPRAPLAAFSSRWFSWRIVSRLKTRRGCGFFFLFIVTSWARWPRPYLEECAARGGACRRPGITSHQVPLS